MNESKRCRKCGVDQPLDKYKKGSWGVCSDCIPKTAPKKRGRPPQKKIVQVIEVAPEALPVTQDTTPPPEESKEKKRRLRKSVRQLNTEQLRRLLNQRMPMELRADIMVELAQKTNEPVTALRALSEINLLTGIRVEENGKLAVPIFALPRGVDVRIVADPVVKQKESAA